MRTTLDIDEAILRDSRRLEEKEGKSFGRLDSNLLAEALMEKARTAATPDVPLLIAKPVHARVELSDKEAVYRILER